MLTEKQKERYARQIISPEIGEGGQEKISNLKILQIGCGGLGSPFALYLTAAGINELTIIDNDTLDISNLQRQILYNETHIGKEKAKSAKNVLVKLNSDIKINAYKDYINEIKDFIDNYLIMRFNTFDINKNLLNLGWEHIYPPDDQHIICPSQNPGNPRMSPTTFTLTVIKETDYITSLIANQWHGFPS